MKYVFIREHELTEAFSTFCLKEEKTAWKEKFYDVFDILDWFS